MIAARSRRISPPPGCVVIVISRRAFREWVADSRRGEWPGSQSPAAVPSPRDFYRLLTRVRTASRDDSNGPPRAPSATLSRPAQALLGDVACHPVGSADGD